MSGLVQYSIHDGARRASDPWDGGSFKLASSLISREWVYILCLEPTVLQVLTEVIQQEKKRLVKAKSRFPVLTAERLRNVMAASKLRMEKAELEQVRGRERDVREWL